MNEIKSFFWYDLETFGRNPSYDRIAQFAGQRTDADLNPIGDPVILYCRLSGDYLPDPEACLVTGITPQEVKRKGIPEAEFISKINALFSESGTCVCGFNTIRFDDEFIRNALYRNFMDPYEREWRNSCSRWDIIDLVRAAHDFRPQGINWPGRSEKGNPVFKLTEMTAANNISQVGAHDAMVDVNATIALARLLREKQPKLFDYYLSLRSKVRVKDILRLQGKREPLLYVNPVFTNPNGCSAVVVPLSADVAKDNTVWCFNLSHDPSALLSCDPKEIGKVPGVIKIAVNKVPFVAPLRILDDAGLVRIGIDKRLCLVHLENIEKNRYEIMDRFLRYQGESYPENNDPDFMIYSSFFQDYDKRNFQTILSTPPENRLSLKLDFLDPRCPEMLWRHVCRNYPQTLSSEELDRFKAFASNRIVNPPGNVINDVFFVENKIAEKLRDPETDEKRRQVLNELSSYVSSLRRYLGITAQQ